MILRRSARLAACMLLVPVVFLAAADRDLFDEAERRFSAGNYALAMERFERLLDEYPGSTYRGQAQLRIAQSSFYLGDFETARERLRRTAVRAQGGQLAQTIQLWIGLTEFQLGEYVSAEEALTRYLESAENPQGRAWLYRGLSRDEQGRGDAAEEDLRRAMEIADGTERAFASAALMELFTERDAVDDVLAVWNDAPVENADDPYAEVRLRYAADAAWSRGDEGLAGELYRRLIPYSTDSAQWAYRRLFAIARDAQDRSGMQAVYREAEQRLAAEPQRLADFWFALGADALDRERYELAELYLSRLWEVRSRQTIDGTAAFLLARAVEEQDRDGEALELLLESLADPGVNDTASAERSLFAARIHTRRGDFEAAAALLEERNLIGEDSATLYTWAFARYRLGAHAQVLARLNATDTQPLVRERPALLRLRARAFLAQGDATEAVRSYRVYLAERPEDRVARVELIRALVAAAQFSAVEQEIRRVDRDGLTEAQNMEIAYLRAVAAFHNEEYEIAREHLESVSAAAYEPLRSYHLAWSLYRLGRSDAARRTIAPVVDTLPPGLEVDGRYLYAWTLYRGGSTDDAREQLLRILGRPLSTDDERRTRGLLATVYLEDGRFDDALTQYRVLADGAEADTDRAQYLRLIAATLASAGRIEESVAQYDEIASQYASVSVGRRSLLEAGELLYGTGDLRRARERFREYQTRFPDGDGIDRALYWAGLTSYEVGEAGRALLWWEPLINRFPRSPFTPEVLFLTAEIYAQRDQRREAVELYDRLVAAYPESPQRGEAERRRRAIRLELDGLSAREAQLWVELEPGGGAGPEEGGDRWFELVLELGRIAIREQITLTRERSRIVDRLLEAAAFDGPQAAEASLLLAEYYRRRGETNAAVDRYVEAAATPGAADELRAQSLFELAVLARDAGDTGTARNALRELRDRYEGSIWADRAERLMESN